MKRRTARLAPTSCLRQQWLRDVWQRLSMVLMLVMLTTATAWAQEKIDLSDVTVVIQEQTYTGSALTPEVTVRNGDDVVSSEHYTVDLPEGRTNAGNYTITITAKEGSNAYEGSTTATFTISKAPLTVTANDHTITYGDEPANNGVRYSGFVGDEDESVLGGTLGFEYTYSQYDAVGEYEISPRGLTAANYDINFESGTLTVDKKSLTVTANDHTIFYGNAAANNGVSYAGFVNGDENKENVLTGELTYTYTNNEGNYGEGNDAPGEYVITPSGLTATNYDIEFRPGTLTVVAVTVKVKVVDTANEEGLSGANVQVLDSEEKVAEWESGTGNHEVGGLRASKTYTIRETAVPDGYILPSDYTFTINENGDVSSYSGNRSEDVMLVENSKTHVEIKVVDTADGEELSGAHIQVLDSEENVIREWNSTTETYVIEGLSTGEEYTIRETIAPEGYVLSADKTFAIATNGTITYSGTKTTNESGNTVLLVQNSMTHVEVSVVGKHNGEKLEGGHVQVIDSEGIADEWDSTTDDNHVIEGLKTGEEYTIHETVAPEGYLLSSDYTFTIDEEGKITTNGPTTVESGKTVLLVENDMCINLSVAINWDDFDNKYGVRPATVTVTLSDGADEISYLLDNNSNPLTCTVEDLQKYKNGTEIDYSWIIDEIDCYEQDEPQVDGTTTTFTMRLITNGNCGQSGSEDAVTWSYNTDTETITISDSGPMMYYNSVYNGETYSNGAPWKAFAGEIERVVISDGITYVGSNTFAHCPKISSVTLPTDQQLYEIGPGAFGDCTSLISIDIPMSVNKIGTEAFAGCSNLATVRLGYGDATHVVTIGKDVFPVTTTILVPNETAYAAYMNAATWNGTATGEDENKTDYTRLLAPTAITLDGNTSGWATYCHNYIVSYNVEDGAAYTVNGINDSNVQTAHADYVDPYTPTLVYKENGGDITLTAVAETATQDVPSEYDSSTGLVTQDGDGFTFVGATTAPVEDCITEGQSYALYGGEFLKIDDSTLDIPAHRCILTLDEQPQYSAPRLRIVMDGETTNLSNHELRELHELSGDGTWYSLDGRKLEKQPTTKGVYIYKGKKVVIK